MHFLVATSLLLLLPWRHTFDEKLRSVCFEELAAVDLYGIKSSRGGNQASNKEQVGEVHRGFNERQGSNSK